MSLETYPVAHVEAMQARLAALEAENKALRERLAPLEAQAKQARDDEEWAFRNAVPIHRRGEAWVAEHFDGRRIVYAMEPTIHAALRALRSKVEGGAR